MATSDKPISFVLPQIHDNSDGSWGPSQTMLPPQFKDIPYAPYSKSDKVGRFADWHDLDAGGRGASALSTAQGGPGGRAPAGNRPGQRQQGGSQQPYGAAAAGNAFAYFHVEDEASFSLVDNKVGGPIRRPGQSGFSRGRGARSGTTGAGRGGAMGRNSARPGANQQGGRNMTAGRMGNLNRRPGWRDWEKPNRTRESSVPISPSWQMLEEISFTQLNKLRLDVEDPETIAQHGRLFAYDKTFDRISTKAEKPLQILDRIRFNTTTSDDPVIQQLAANDTATIFTTDAILGLLMCAPRSVYPWDIVIIREGNKLFLDKRDGGPFDFITVNENAADPPTENDKDKDSINSPGSLSLEATFVDQHFSFQAVKEDMSPLDFPEPNPFYGPEETEPLASCGYRYRAFDLSVHDDEDVRLVVRTQVEAYIPGPQPQLVSLRTLNEFDSRAQGAGGAPDWRTKLDSQRGAVVATEMKNNSCKLAKWAVQSILAGADVMKIGYVSRANPRDNSRHVILSTATLRPTDFASQLNVSLSNGWGIVRTVADLCMKVPDGKYLLIKDPNKPVVRLYSVPANAFTAEEEDVFPERVEEEPAE